MRQEATSFSAAVVDRQRQPGRAGWWLLSPVVFWAIAFVIAPAIIMFVYSFARRGTLGGVVLGFTLENYAAVLDPVYLQIVIRSIIYAAITTSLCLAAGYPVAFLIGRADPRWRNLLLMAVMVPFWTSFLVRTFAMIFLLRDSGLINSILLSTGIVNQPVALLYTPFAVLLGLVYGFLPFMIAAFVLVARHVGKGPAIFPADHIAGEVGLVRPEAAYGRPRRAGFANGLIDQPALV